MRGRTDVLREIRPGCDGAWEVVYASVSMLRRLEGRRAGMAGWVDEWMSGWLTDGADSGHVDNDGESFQQRWESGQHI